jgi:hypothetical protein
MLSILCHFHGLLVARQGSINCDATQRNAPHPPRNAYRYRLSMSAFAIYHSLRLRRNATSGLSTIQEFCDDTTIIIVCSPLRCLETMAFGHLKGSLVEVYIFNAGSFENWIAGVGIFPELQELPVGSFCLYLVSR